jgi:hypothetical protein
MGAIRAAYDRVLARTVALKELKGELPRHYVERFVREAKLTGELQHPGIVPVHDFGLDEEGKPFYCMKLVKGRTLEEVMGEAKTYESRLALLPHMVSVAEALAFAHEQRVVHRDLKPGNVLVGEFGETVVIDWGLAKRLSRGASAGSHEEERGEQDDGVDGDAAPHSVSEDPELTSAGSLLGTVSYMAPEQASGGEVTCASDVYALGVMLYRLLTGHSPYSGTTTIEVLQEVMKAEYADIKRMEEKVAEDLATVVRRCMQKEPAERYETAGELLKDLKAFVEGRLVASYEYSSWELFRRWVAKNRALVTAGLTAVVAIVAVSTFAYLRIVNALIEVERARSLEQEARALEQKARALEQKARADYERQREAAGQTLMEYGRALMDKGDFDRATEVFVEAWELLEQWDATREGPPTADEIAKNEARTWLARLHLKWLDRGLADLAVVPGDERDFARIQPEISADGTTLGVMSKDGVIQVWDIRGAVPAEIRRVSVESQLAASGAQRVLLSANGAFVVFEGEEEIRFWSVADGREAAQRLRSHQRDPVTFANDGCLVAVKMTAAMLAFYDLCSGGQPLNGTADDAVGGGEVVGIVPVGPRAFAVSKTQGVSFGGDRRTDSYREVELYTCSAGSCVTTPVYSSRSRYVDVEQGVDDGSFRVLDAGADDGAAPVSWQLWRLVDGQLSLDSSVSRPAGEYTTWWGKNAVYMGEGDDHYWLERDARAAGQVEQEMLGASVKAGRDRMISFVSDEGAGKMMSAYDAWPSSRAWTTVFGKADDYPVVDRRASWLYDRTPNNGAIRLWRARPRLESSVIATQGSRHRRQMIPSSDGRKIMLVHGAGSPSASVIDLASDGVMSRSSEITLDDPARGSDQAGGAPVDLRSSLVTRGSARGSFVVELRDGRSWSIMAVSLAPLAVMWSTRGVDATSATDAAVGSRICHDVDHGRVVIADGAGAIRIVSDADGRDISRTDVPGSVLAMDCHSATSHVAILAREAESYRVHFLRSSEVDETPHPAVTVFSADEGRGQDGFFEVAFDRSGEFVVVVGSHGQTGCARFDGGRAQVCEDGALSAKVADRNGLVMFEGHHVMCPAPHVGLFFELPAWGIKALDVVRGTVVEVGSLVEDLRDCSSFAALSTYPGVVITNGDAIQIRASDDGGLLASLPGDGEPFAEVAITPDESTLVARGVSGEVRSWSLVPIPLEGRAGRQKFVERLRARRPDLWRGYGAPVVRAPPLRAPDPSARAPI